MTTLSSLPPPSFVSGLAPAGDASLSAPPSWQSLLEPAADASPLHVGPAGVRTADEIERDFVAALCDTPLHPHRA